MIVSKTRKRQIDYTWPGFVDALSSLLMVIIFVLMIFVLSQFFLSQKMSGQDEALVNLRNNLAELGELLSLERVPPQARPGPRESDGRPPAAARP